MAGTINPKMVAELRAQTGAGMSDCKKALEDANGTFDDAVKLLRERGILKAGKRSDRVAAEGIAAFAASDDRKTGALVELNSETDFAARNDMFIAAAGDMAKAAVAAKAGSIEALLAAPAAGGTVKNLLEDINARIREKIDIGRVELLTGDAVAGYIHPPGKMGVIVAGTATGVDPAKAAEVLRDVAMHVAASAPLYLDDKSVDPAVLASERDIAINKARNEGKPEAILPKIAEGVVRAYLKQNCLLTQEFAKDESKTVAEFVAGRGKELGGSITVTGFRRVLVGETAKS